MIEKFIEVIKQYNNRSKLTAIYLSTINSDSFVLGKIQHLDPEYFIIYCIDKFGKYDGYLFGHTEDITRIEVDSKYIKAVELQLVNDNQIKDIEANCSSIDSVIKLIYSKNKVATFTFDTNDSEITGYILDVKEDVVSIQQLNNYGEKDGVLVFLIESIQTIEWDSQEEIRLEEIAK